MRLRSKEITITIARPGYHEDIDQPPPAAHLPLPPEELLDLINKARIDHPDQEYEVRVEHCSKPYLENALADQPLDIFELNHLALYLAIMEPEVCDVFEGFMKMEGSRKSVPLARIMCLVLAAENNPIARGITNDEELGRHSFAQNMPDGVADIPDEYREYIDFSKIGWERRILEKGAFTRHGYVWKEQSDEEINSLYAPGSHPMPEDALPEEVLRVKYYRFDLELEVAGDLELITPFPITTEDYRGVLDERYCTEDELSYIPQYCIIPSILDYLGDMEHVEDLNALAVCLDGAKATGNLPLYKAVLEATECESVKVAAHLGARLHEYNLDTSITEPAQYAKADLAAKFGQEEGARLAKYMDLAYYADDAMDKDGVVATEYGYLHRLDHAPIQSQDEADIEQDQGQQFC